MSLPVPLLPAIFRGMEIFGPVKKALPQVVAITAVINVLALAPTVYMLQVYDRVMASSHRCDSAGVCAELGIGMDAQPGAGAGG